MVHSDVIGRLAPSPTGALHLGNARSFLLAWLSARQQSGKIFLRIEDIDSPRVKPWAMEQTIEDLEWLGLDWDEFGAEDGATESTSSPIWKQSSRLDRYQEVFDRMIQAGVVYPCVCSRADVAAAASAPHGESISNDSLRVSDSLLAPGQAAAKEPREGLGGGNPPVLEGLIYPGTCRERELTPDQRPQSYCWRWHFAAGQVQWHDQLHGRQIADPARQLGDFVIARSDGLACTPSYQLAVVVDDHDQGVTEVVRGDDLIFSTYRQLAIAQFMDWATPKYIHVPLIVGGDGRRLAKRHGDTRVSHLREHGVKSSAIVGYLAWTANLVAEPSPFTAAELVGALDWSKLSLEPTVFELARDLQLLQSLSR